MASLSFTAGQLVTAAELNLLVPTYVVKGNSQAVTNSATPVNDNDIVLQVPPNQTVEVDFWGRYQGTGTTNAGLRLLWTITNTVAAVSRWTQGPADTGGAAVPDAVLMQTRAFVIGTNNLYTSGIVANIEFALHEKLVLTGGVSGGTLQMQFSQFTAVAGQSMNMNAGTFAVMRVIA